MNEYKKTNLFEVFEFRNFNVTSICYKLIGNDLNVWNMFIENVYYISESIHFFIDIKVIC